jgi:hypothetical protein
VISENAGRGDAVAQAHLCNPLGSWRWRAAGLGGSRGLGRPADGSAAAKFALDAMMSHEVGERARGAIAEIFRMARGGGISRILAFAVVLILLSPAKSVAQWMNAERASQCAAIDVNCPIFALYQS